MQRNPAYDLLRTAAMFAVVWLHVAAAAVIPGAALERPGWLAADLLAAFSRWSVPAFVLLSGALLLARPLHVNPRAFYRKRARRILLPLLFWTVFYILWIFLNQRSIDFAPLWRPILQGRAYYHLWFLYMTACLSLAAPGISWLLARIRPAGQPALALLFLAGGMADLVWRRATGIPDPYFILQWIPYTGYFILGGWLAKRPPRYAPGVYAAVFVLAGLLTAAAAAGLLAAARGLPWDLAFEYFSPPVALAALAAFRWCQALPAVALAKHAARLRKFADLSLGVYLVHPIFLDLALKFGLRVDAAPLLLIPLTSAAIFALALGLAAVLAAHPRTRALI